MALVVSWERAAITYVDAPSETILNRGDTVDGSRLSMFVKDALISCGAITIAPDPIAVEVPAAVETKVQTAPERTATPPASSAPPAVVPPTKVSPPAKKE